MTGEILGYRPHMADNHIAFQLAYREQLCGVGERNHRVHGNVKALDIRFFAVAAVVEEKVVEKSRAGAGSCVKTELSADEKVVVGHVKAVLRPGSTLVVLVFVKLKHGIAAQQVAYAAIIVRQVVYIFMGKYRFVLIITF